MSTNGIWSAILKHRHCADTGGCAQVDHVDLLNKGAHSHTDIDDHIDNHPGGGGVEYMIPIWAEENAALAANAYEWAFGNGANTPSDGGLTVYVPSGFTCHIVAMSLRIGSGTATVQLVHNGTSKGSDANVVVATGQSATNELDTPLEISNGDYINFRTQAASGTSSPNVVTAWLKYEKT